MSNNDIIRSLHRACRSRRTLGLAFVAAFTLAASACGGEPAADEGRSGDEQEQTETSGAREDGAADETAETGDEAVPVDDGEAADGGAPAEDVVVGDPSSEGSVELPDGLAGFVPVPTEWIVTSSSVIEDESGDIVYIGFDIGGSAEDAAEKLRDAMLAGGFVEESFIGTQDSESFTVLASWDRDGRNVFVTIGDDVERPGTAIGAVTVSPSI